MLETFGPACSMVSFKASARRPRMTTRQFSAASFKAMARPTPLPPPVTTAVLFITPPIALFPLTSLRHPSLPEREHHHGNSACTDADCGWRPQIPMPDHNGTSPADRLGTDRAVSQATSRTRAESRLSPIPDRLLCPFEVCSN